MNKKLVLSLLSALHISIFALAVILIYKSMFGVTDISASEEYGTILADEQLIVEATETETETEPESTQIEQETETETQMESETEIEPEPIYTFTSTNRIEKLNIRESPSLSAPIIGKVPPNSVGNVINFENEDWAFVEYNGITGYCYRQYLRIE